jgi:hypothetical protein
VRHFTMKPLIILFLILSLVFSLKVVGQTEKLSTYKIEIRQWGLMVIGDITWEITPATILIKKQNLNGSVDTFTKKLNRDDRLSIISLLKKIDQEKYTAERVTNPPDDMGEYDFEIQLDNKKVKFHLYQIKIDEVFNLVSSINTILPAEYQIGYNDEYFRYLKPGA